MLSLLKKIDIYEISVDPCNSTTWVGLFNFKPNAEDVATAIRQDISELDPEVEHEADLIAAMSRTLELVSFQMTGQLGPIRIAGTAVGEISSVNIKVFAREEPSMMPHPTLNPCGEEFLGGQSIAEALDTDPRTGETLGGRPRSDGGIVLTDAQRANLASENMRGGTPTFTDTSEIRKPHSPVPGEL